jgi:biopolymer transport protein ExbD
MPFRIKNNDEDEILAQINIIPLVDVSLVLLIIFIVTVNHILTPSIRIKLPQSSHASAMSDIESIDISISSEGVIYLENEVVTLKELKTRVENIHAKDPERGVILNIDKSVHFQRVVDALDIFNGLHLRAAWLCGLRVAGVTVS